MFSATAIAVSHLLPASATAEKVDRKLVVRAQVEAATLWRKGYVVEDAQVDSMLQAILDSMVSDYSMDPGIKLRVHLFRSPEINAFALPDGSLYVFVGLLANLSTMDQLAFILGHEAYHAIDLHAQKNLAQAKSKSALVGILSIGSSIALGSSGIAGAGLIDTFAQLGLSLAGAASIHGYGRELERSADEAGLAMIQRAGRPGCAAVHSMQVLLASHDGQGRISNFFWGSHPLLVDRIAYLEEASRETCDDELPQVAPDFAGIHWPMLKKTVELWLLAGNPTAGLRPALRYCQRFPEDAEIHRHLGDVYRGVGTPDTLALAASEYEVALALGDAPLPLRGLALVAEARGDTAACIGYLERYLAGGVDVPNRRSLQRKLQQLMSRAVPGAETIDTLSTREPD